MMFELNSAGNAHSGEVRIALEKSLNPQDFFSVDDEAAKRVEWMQCDLSDFEATGKLAFAIAEKIDRLDILINNAARGIMTYRLAAT